MEGALIYVINDKNREKTHRTDCSGTGRVAWREKNFVFFVFKRKKSFKPRGEQNKGPKKVMSSSAV